MTTYSNSIIRESLLYLDTGLPALEFPWWRYDGLMAILSSQWEPYTLANGNCTGSGHWSPLPFQWDLVCDKASYVATSQTIFSVGVASGALLCAPLSDYFGRKWVFFICQALMSVLGLAMAFSPSYVVFCVFQFLTGVVSQVHVMICSVINRHRLLSKVWIPESLRQFHCYKLSNKLQNKSVWYIINTYVKYLYNSQRVWFYYWHEINNLSKDAAKKDCHRFFLSYVMNISVLIADDVTQTYNVTSLYKIN